MQADAGHWARVVHGPGADASRRITEGRRDEDDGDEFPRT